MKYALIACLLLLAACSRPHDSSLQNRQFCASARDFMWFHKYDAVVVNTGNPGEQPSIADLCGTGFYAAAAVLPNFACPYYETHTDRTPDGIPITTGYGMSCTIPVLIDRNKKYRWYIWQADAGSKHLICGGRESSTDSDNTVEWCHPPSYPEQTLWVKAWSDWAKHDGKFNANNDCPPSSSGGACDLLLPSPKPFATCDSQNGVEWCY